MNLTGEHRIEAPREAVWRALNDPEVLKRAIPGCREIEKESATAFAARVTARIGPVSATFRGRVALSDLDPPNAYTISGEGQGGVAGFAKGGARVTLEADGAATVLRYEAEGQVGGKLAQVGARLVEGSARKIADRFFGALDDLVAQPSRTGEEPAATAEAPAANGRPPPRPVYGAPAEASFENLWFGFIGLALLVLLVAGAVAQ